jgi:hypothetical protein
LLNVLQNEPSKEASYSEKEDKKLYYEVRSPAILQRTAD